MFWTDWEDDKARIERAFTDGSNRTLLKATDLKFPNGLAIDFNTHKLYWCDAGTNLIGWMNFDGTSSQVLYRSLSHPFGLDVYHDKLYWTDWKKTSIFQGSKHGGSKTITVLKKQSEYLYGVRIFSKEHQSGSLPQTSLFKTLLLLSLLNEFYCTLKKILSSRYISLAVSVFEIAS